MEGEQDFKRDIVEASIRGLQEQAAREAADKANKFIAGDSGKAMAEHVLNKASASVDAGKEAKKLREENERALRLAKKNGPAGS